jgi:hypothetical protein
LLIKAFWGVDLPRVQVCPEHVAPFKAVADAFFAREPGYAVWYASRGSGKSLALAVLGLTKTLVLDVDTTILGGSMTQSQNVATHMSDLLHFKRAPVYALKGGSVDKGVTATQITTSTGKRVRPIPASQTTVRGPHPPLSLLDEVDEMDLAIFDAAMGQAMEQLNSRGEIIGEYIVASSTWQNPDGTFTEIMERARRKNQPIYTWCWRELLEPHGWMSKRFIDQKRLTVSEEMWRTEYELNEPSGASRAFDLDAIERYFVPYQPPLHMRVEENDAEWTWEEPDASGLYAVGADWAKEKDKTVIACIRYDVFPRRLVYLRRVNRQSYKLMINGFDRVVQRYNAVGKHDKTGLGNVVSDFSEGVEDGTVSGFNFAGRAKRSQMLLGYITDFEAGGYRLPRPPQGATPENDALREFYKSHRSTTTGDVYGNNKWDSHLPDDVAAMGLAHMAAGSIPQGMVAVEIPTDPRPREVDKQFHIKPGDDQDGFIRTVGDVTVDDSLYSDIADFGFLAELDVSL